jgi:uncharacterized repeat protein (TIGR02543 family)
VSPSVTITNNVLTNNGTTTSTSATTFTITFSSAVTGFTASSLAKTGTNWTLGTLSGSGTTYTITATGNGNSGAEGVITLKVNAAAGTDKYGNTSAASTTFTGNWIATITYNSNSGGVAPKVSEAQSTPTSAITLPGVGSMVKTGNSFAGWSTTQNGSSVGNSYTPTSNIILYAVWTPAVYVVTYNGNGGSGAAAKASENYTYGSSALTLPAVGTLVKTGYTFLGWNTATNSTTALASSYTPTATITLYAVWQGNNYNVTFDKNNVSAAGTMTSLPIVAGTPKLLTANAFTLTGYGFSGWNTSANGSGTAFTNSQTVTLFANTTVYAQWTILAPGVPSAVSASAGNGQATVSVTGVNASISVGAASSFTVTAYDANGTAVGSCTISSPATSCVVTGLTNGTAYTFKASATNSSGTSALSSASTAITPAGFVVTYNANNGGANTTATYNSGTPLRLPLPSKAGYNFVGWYSESLLTTLIGADGASYSPSGAVTLYAKWAGITYTITYSSNGGTGGAVPTAGSYINGGTAYPVVGNTGSLTKTGYTFSKWNTKPDGSGTDYVATNTYSSAADIVLYAKWTPDVYTVTYSANGGTGQASKTSDSYTYGTSGLALPDKGNLDKSGFTFMGWVKSGETTTVTSPFIPTANSTLNAYWVGNTYSITFNANGGSGTVTGTSFQVGTTGVTLSSGSTLSRTGYIFSGWSTNPNGTTLVTSPYSPSSDVTLYAKWSALTINISYNKGTINATTPTLTNFPSNTTSTYGSQFTISSNVDTQTVLSGGTYAFAGWSDASTVFSGGSKYSVGISNITLTAQWIQVFTLHYNINGGVGTVDADQLYAVGSTFTLPTNPTRTGYNFDGWQDQSGATITSCTTDPTDLANPCKVSTTRYILSAQWSPKTITVTYIAGTGSGTLPTSSTGAYGTTTTLPDSTGLTAPAQSVFDGWDIGGVKYGAGAVVSLINDVTATAQWKNNFFSIYFDLNGGTSATPSALTGANGTSVNLPSNPTRAGYVFSGWNTGTILPANTTTTTIESKSTTYLATWSLASPGVPTISSVSASDGAATITVTPDVNGGAPSSYTVTASPATPSPATCTVFAPATSCSIAPLTNGTSYTFSATANNAAGTSSSSAPSSSVTPAGKPSVPTGVVATPGNTSASLSWTAPASNGGATIQSYTATASPGGATCTTSGTSCTVSGLVNGTTYTFVVKANNGAGISNDSASSAAITPATNPDAPTSVAATSNTASTASVTFTAPLNNGGASISSYTVTATPTAGGATKSATGSSSPISISGLTNGVEYTYTVTATNIVGTSIASSASSALTTAAPANAPTTVSAVANNQGATVTFSGTSTNGATINSYTVAAFDLTGTATGNTCTVTTSATSGSCSVTGLTNGIAYTFKVTVTSTANGNSSTSSYSSPSSSVIPAAAPDAPIINTPLAGDNKVRVSWSPGNTNGATVSGYTVTAFDVDGNPITNPPTCTVAVGTNACDITGLAVGVNYTFKVVANATPANSSASQLSTPENMISVPSTPNAPTVSGGNGSAIVSVGTAPSENGYAISSYVVTASSGGATCTVTVPASSCTISGLTNGTSYTFTTQAVNQLGRSTASSASSATPSTKPSAPTNVVAAARDASAEITFNAGATGGASIISYTVTSSPDGATATGTASPITVSNLQNGTAYTFTVTATNSNGPGAASNPSAAVTPRASSRPELSNSSVPNGAPEVGQTLTSSARFSGFPVPTITYQWLVCENATDIQSCTDISGANSSTFTVTGDQLGKFIRVETVASNGLLPNAENTSSATAEISPEISLPAPTGSTSAATGSSYTLNIQGSGGKAPFIYAISSGNPPIGLTLNTATGQIAGTPTTAGTYTFTVRATDSNGVYKDVVITIIVAAVTQPVTNPQTPTEPQPRIPTCDADCQAAKEAAATKAAAEKAAADAIAKAAADKAAADAAAAAKKASDAAATNASTKAAADAAAAAAAAKAAIDKAAAAAVAQAAADAAAKVAAAQAKAAADAQVAAAKAAADAAAALKNSTATAAAKAAAAASANKSAADAAAAVKAAATAAQQAAQAKTSASNANKQVEIAINSLNSKTATSQASAQANAVAAAAKAAADAAAKAAADAATAAKANATAAQKAASDTAARIATEQKQAADAAALAKIAADAAVKATAEKVAAVAAATKASQDLATVLAQKATLAEQAAKATDQTARAEIQKKIEEVTTKVEEVQKTVEVATTKADATVAVQVTAVQTAEAATKEATNQAAEAVAVKAESVVKTAEATKAVAAASVAAKVATAAKEAAAKIPSKAVITTKSSSTASNNSATATVTGLKPGQKVKVTVNVKDK